MTLYTKELQNGHLIYRIAPFRPKGTSSILVMTDFTLDEVSEDDNFILSASGGTVGYSKSLSCKDDNELYDEFIGLIFDNVPIDAKYTLRFKGNDGKDLIIFEDIPYNELASISDNEEEVIDPW